MANAVYDSWKELVGNLGIGSGTRPAGTLKAALVDTGSYTFSQDHDYFDDVSDAVVGTPQAIGNAAFTGKTLDGDDVTYEGLTGNSVEAVVIYLDTGDPETSPLIAYLDTGVTGLPFTPSGADVTLQWDSDGILDL